jgi:cytochrome c oxidase cbb3-type subunit 3
MSSRYLTRSAFAAMVLLAAGCNKSSEDGLPSELAKNGGVIDTALTPGSGQSLVTHDPRADAYYNNAEAVTTGKALFNQYNCSGCHSNGGGGMGPPLMDGAWIYGSRLEQIHQTLVEGRPNGMPAWGNKIPDPQLWQIAAYVRSMSLPETLAAETGNTPSQSPAPVPKEVDDNAGWAPRADTTTDYGTTTKGPE